MKKFFPHISASIIMLVFIFMVSISFFPQTTYAQPGAGWSRLSIGRIFSFATDILLAPLGWASLLVLQISTLVAYLGGSILNLVVQYTVVEMAANISKANIIESTWKAIRDLANIGFIFILLYAAIKTILGIGSDTKKLIINVIIIAILINFSLFFTKVVIDVSNVLAITFYDAIAPGRLVSDDFLNTGLAGHMMNPLELQSLWNTNESALDKVKIAFEGKKLIIIGIMGSLVTLIAAFVFFAVAIMFVVRFVVLIFVLILSPIAFMAFVLPALKKIGEQWKDALFGQAFFAPIFFMLMWIVLNVTNSLFTVGNGTMREAIIGSFNEDGSISAPKLENTTLLINFIIIIAFYIAALVIAKSWANRAGPTVSGITKFATGLAGGAAFGGAAWAGRKSFGALGKFAADRASLQEAAIKKTGLPGAAARLALYASRKAQSGTFDVRNAAIPTNMAGDVVRGTLGRTKMGKTMGMDDVNIPSIKLGAFAAGQTGVGVGGTKGFKQTYEESRKRVHEREASDAREMTLAVARKDILKGSPEEHEDVDQDLVNKMALALTKLTDKQTEELVAGNRKLLKSQEFANSLNVKQLEALNKSDRLSDDEKALLAENRFKKITTALTSADGATSVGGDIKGLSDTELEMLNPDLFSNEGFVSQLRAAQVEFLTQKSNTLNTNQKNALKKTRRAPLLAAVNDGSIANTKKIVRGLGVKEIAGLDMDELKKETMLAALSVQLLRRLAPEMNPADVQDLRDTIAWRRKDPDAPKEILKLAEWLNTSDGEAAFS